MLFDYDLELLKDIVGTIDQYLENINQRSTEVDDPDSFGYFDRAEHVVGLGFVACQTYIVAVCGHLGVRKQDAFSFGPKHSSEQTVVQIVNHAANYWKHNSEWAPDKNEKQRKYVEHAFEAVGFPVGTDYPLSGVLTELTYPQTSRFESLVELLINWKNDLEKDN
jgi:hypothetical protein